MSDLNILRSRMRLHMGLAIVTLFLLYAPFLVFPEVMHPDNLANRFRLVGFFWCAVMFSLTVVQVLFGFAHLKQMSKRLLAGETFDTKDRE